MVLPLEFCHFTDDIVDNNYGIEYRVPTARKLKVQVPLWLCSNHGQIMIENKISNTLPICFVNLFKRQIATLLGSQRKFLSSYDCHRRGALDGGQQSKQ